MKAIIKTAQALLVGIMLLALFAGCTSKPGDSQVEAAVKVALEKSVPMTWVGNMMGGKNAKITTVEIQNWGSFNEEQKYWPVKIRVVGSAELKDPFNAGKVKKFDKVADFRLRQDDYGKWEAFMAGGMFQ